MKGEVRKGRTPDGSDIKKGGKRSSGQQNEPVYVNTHTTYIKTSMGGGPSRNLIVQWIHNVLAMSYVLVHMFGVTYSVAISIDQLVEPVIDDVGFLYHRVTFENKKKVNDETNRVMSFALMLPHKDKEGYLRYCLLDKDWRFVQGDGQWSILD
jgi:hypothetical protein